MRRSDDGPQRPRSWLGRPVAACVLLAAGTLTACTTSPKLDPPNAPNAVVASADRIHDGQTRLGASSACLQDAYCAAGLSRDYGLNLGSGGVELDTPDGVVEALVAGAIDIGALPASAVEADDSRITPLADDRQLVPAENVVPIAGPAAAAAGGPDLTAAADAVSAAISTAGLTALEQALAGGAPPDVAAGAWLQTHPVHVGGPPHGAVPLVVGARDDTESQALADLYAGALARSGWAASVSPVGGGQPEELDALSLGKVALVPDEVSSLLELLAGFDDVATYDLQHDLVLLRYALADRGLVAFEPAPASSGTVFAVNRDVAEALSVRSLSDLARAARSHLPPPAVPDPLTPAEADADTEGPIATPFTLGIGSTGASVVAVQDRLQQLGYPRPLTSGLFDESTRRDVAAFQADQGLISNGEVGPDTARALFLARPGGRVSQSPLPGDDDTLRPPPIAPNPGGTSAGAPADTPSGPSGDTSTGSYPGTSAPGTSGTSGTAGTVYLAFADGPASPATDQILGLLAQAGARATFFVEPGAVASNPETLRRIQAAGDPIGMSAPPHNDASPVAEDALFRTVSADQETVAAVDGQTPTCLLTPYGASDPGTRARATSLGLKAVVWDVDPQDWRHPGSSVIATDVIDAARPGSIVLLHDGGGDRAQTVTALERILSTLTSLGYGFASLPGC